MPQWLMPQLQEILKSIGQRLPTLGAALGVLVLGWIVALVLRKATFAGLQRTKVDDKIAELIGFETGGDFGDRVERIIASTVYWIAMAVVFVVFFSVLGVDAITHPLVAMLSGFTGAVPSIAKAAMLGLIGITAAMIVRSLIVKVLEKVNFDKRFGTLVPELAQTEPAEEAPKGKKSKKKAEPQKEGLSHTIGNVAYWVILLITAVPVIEALQIGVLARPLSAALETVTTYAPRVLGAGVIMAIGYLVARVLRAATSGVLERIGLDKAMDRIGIGKALGEHTVSKLVGTVVFALILVQASISALGRLQIEEISRPATQALEQVYAYVPKLFVGSFLLMIGVLLARVVGNLVSSLVAALGFNTLLGHIGVAGGASEEAKAQEAEAKQALDGTMKAIDAEKDPVAIDGVLAAKRRLRTPSDMLGLVASAVVVLLFLRQALSTMHLEALASMLDGLIAYLPSVAVAGVVLVAGLWAGRWASSRIDEMTAKSSDPLVRGLGRVAHVGVVLFASLVSLQQLGVGRELISLAFGLLLGAICLALALAFGLGGRDVASRILQKQYDKRQR